MVMKKNSTFFAVFCAVWLLAAPRAPRAQQSSATITIDSVSGITFCAGDPISVTFTVTDMWELTNAFTLQLSNDSGTFDQGLQDLGSIKDIDSGTFSIVSSIPLTADYGTQYRVRVTGAKPYTESADNGRDLAIGEQPVSFLFEQITAYEVGILVAIPIFPDDDPVPPPPGKLNSDTIYWNFGSGASPSGGFEIGLSPSNNNGRLTTTYSTPGLKTVVVRSVAPGGCSVSDTFYTYLYDCTNPVIPHDAIEVSSNLNIDTITPSSRSLWNLKSIWVNPGVTFTGGGYDTIYAEPGSIIDSGVGNIVYLNKGAMYSGNSDAMVIYAEDASASGGSPSFQCPDLAFDYTVAPPNFIMHINENESVAPSAPVAQLEVSPNPTNGNLTLQNIPMGANVMVMNVLGETVQTENARGNTNLSLDLSNFTAGTYYIRIASGNSVTTKSIVKE